MNTLSSTELRANLFSVMARVNDDRESVIVIRAAGRPVAMGSLEAWAGMDEATCRMASPGNRRRLPPAIVDRDEARQGGRMPADLGAMERP